MRALSAASSSCRRDSVRALLVLRRSMDRSSACLRTRRSAVVACCFLMGCQIQSTIQEDAGHHRIIGPCDALPRIEEPPVQQGGQAFEAFTLVGGLSLCPVPGLRLAEGRIPLGYLSFQLPGLPSEVLDTCPCIIHPPLRPVQLCAYGGDLLNHVPQGGVLITYLVFQQRHPRGPCDRTILVLRLRPRRPLGTRQNERKRQHAQNRPNS